METPESRTIYPLPPNPYWLRGAWPFHIAPMLRAEQQVGQKPRRRLVYGDLSVVASRVGERERGTLTAPATSDLRIFQKGWSGCPREQRTRFHCDRDGAEKDTESPAW